jgi:hypothetical protein
LNKELERARSYRERAESLLRIGERTKNDRHKAIVLGLAALYHNFAEQLETVHEADVGPSGRAED